MLDFLLTLVSTILLARFVFKHARRNFREYAEYRAKQADGRSSAKPRRADSALTKLARQAPGASRGKDSATAEGGHVGLC